MEYNPQVAVVAMRVAQQQLNNIDELQWATIACTYTDDDNMQLHITSPNFKKPIVIGFATFMNLTPYQVNSLITGKISGALIQAVKEMD